MRSLQEPNPHRVAVVRLQQRGERIPVNVGAEDVRRVVAGRSAGPKGQWLVAVVDPHHPRVVFGSGEGGGVHRTSPGIEQERKVVHEQGELAKVRKERMHHHRLRGCFHGFAGAGVEVLSPLRLHGQTAEKPVVLVGGGEQVVVEKDALQLHVGEPLVVDGLPGRHARIVVPSDAGPIGHQKVKLDEVGMYAGFVGAGEQLERVAAQHLGELVGEADPNAFPGVRPDDQGLGLLSAGAHRLFVLGQDEKPAFRVVPAVPVVGDGHLDGHDVILALRGLTRDAGIDKYGARARVGGEKVFLELGGFPPALDPKWGARGFVPEGSRDEVGKARLVLGRPGRRFPVRKRPQGGDPFAVGVALAAVLQRVEGALQAPHAVHEVRVQVAVDDGIAHRPVQTPRPVQDGHRVGVLGTDRLRVDQVGVGVVGVPPPLMGVVMEHVRLLNPGMNHPDRDGVTYVGAQDARCRIPVRPGIVVHILAAAFRADHAVHRQESPVSNGF